MEITITLDAINWKNKNDFFNSYCKETKAPRYEKFNNFSFFNNYYINIKKRD